MELIQERTALAMVSRGKGLWRLKLSLKAMFMIVRLQEEHHIRARFWYPQFLPPAKELMFAQGSYAERPSVYRRTNIVGRST